jgi:metal-sulfur cluster biosynthetic enzyme
MPVLHRGPDAGIPEPVTSHKSGGRDLWSPPRPRPDDPVAGVWACLDEVLDPELPVSLVELGLVYGVEIRGDRATVDLTFTATACPCMDFIRGDVRERLLREPWIGSVEIRDVWDPPWTSDRVTDRGRERLRRMGVAL